jgi:hypothetical protein
MDRWTVSREAGRAKRAALLRLVVSLGVLALAMLACDMGSTTLSGTTPVTACATQTSNTTQVNAESHFESNFASAPVTGAAIVTNGIFSNLYLWPVDKAPTWDKYIVTLDPSIALQNEKSETLDRITCDLVHSSYFDALTQYGIAPPVFAGEETTIASCAKAAITNGDQNNGVIQWGALSDFVGCEQSATGSKSTQVNIFVSPDLKVAEHQQTADMCNKDGGYHSWNYGTQNFTQLPTSASCSGSIAALTKVLSHEMVETISDPAGFGWIHETYLGRYSDPNPGNYQAELGSGELGDICSSRGAHTTPSVTFTDPAAGVGPLDLAPYWSNADNACVPTGIMNSTLATRTGDPIIRFTGDPPHSVTLPVTPTLDGPVQELEIAITTGGDNLNGGSNQGDNATVTLNLNIPGEPSLSTFATNNINEGNEWSDDTLHTAFVNFPPGIKASDIVSVTLGTGFTGGDNWNVNRIVLEAVINSQAQSCRLTPVTLVNMLGGAQLADGSVGLFRMTGQAHTLSFFNSAPGADRNLLLSSLVLTIGTGGDNLNGGNSPSDNVDALFSLRSNPTQPVTFLNINGSGSWSNFSSASIPIPLSAFPANTTVGDIVGVTLWTSFSGNDNWDIASVSLLGSAGCARSGGAPSAPRTLIITNQKGTATLGDGSIGLARLTGDNHSWQEMFNWSPTGVNGTLVGLQLTITTGGDDLRGGNDNADVVISYGNIGTQTYSNINQSEEWNNGQTHTVTLAPIPASAMLHDVQSISIVTHSNSGSGTDNWDIAAVELVATFQA